MEDTTIEIKIRKSIFDKISNRIKDPTKGFENADEYINYILENVLNDLENESKSDDDEVKEELKKLGYI